MNEKASTNRNTPEGSQGGGQGFERQDQGLETRAHLETYRTWATEIAKEAGEITLYYFRRGVEVTTKQDESPVTKADLETEEFLRKRIRDRFPSHGIIGEEFESEQAEDDSYTWIVDPIDGTKSFVHGVPLYTVLIALCRGTEPLVGVIHNPFTEEVVSAARGGGCLYNGDPAGVSNCDALSQAWLQVTDYVDFLYRRPSAARTLFSQVAAGRTWADGYGYLLVATGRSDAMIDPIMHPWDVAAVKPVILEAGGRFSDFAGNEEGLGDSAVASAPGIHDELLRILRENE